MHQSRHADALAHLVTPQAGAEMEDAVILHELHGHSMAFAVWQVFRLLSFWIEERPEGRRCFEGPGPVRALLADLAGVQDFADDDPRAAVVLLLIELLSPEREIKPMSRACFVIADWALSQSAVSTALAYTRTAVRLRPDARAAFVTGQLHRESSRLAESEPWFEASYELATGRKDWETSAHALMGWGRARLMLGRYVDARTLFRRAHSLCRRHGLDELRWNATHYLFVVAASMNDRTSARMLSSELSHVFDPHHPRYPYFAHDHAVVRMGWGENEPALEVLLQLLERSFFDDSPARLLTIGSASQAAGGAARYREFDRLLSDLNAARRDCSRSPFVPQALLAAARGAVSLRRWADAEDLLLPALAAASASGQEDTQDEVERLLIRMP